MIIMLFCTGITCSVQYVGTCKEEKKAICIKAKSSVSSLVNAVCRSINCTARYDVDIFDGNGVKIEDRAVLVESFPWDTNFTLSKLPLLHSLN